MNLKTYIEVLILFLCLLWIFLICLLFKRALLDSFRVFRFFLSIFRFFNQFLPFFYHIFYLFFLLSVLCECPKTSRSPNRPLFGTICRSRSFLSGVVRNGLWILGGWFLLNFWLFFLGKWKYPLKSGISRFLGNLWTIDKRGILLFFLLATF